MLFIDKFERILQFGIPSITFKTSTTVLTVIVIAYLIPEHKIKILLDQIISNLTFELTHLWWKYAIIMIQT